MKHIQALVGGWLENLRPKILKALEEPLNVEEKSGRKDLVTQVDKAVEAYLVQQIRQHFPEALIIGEEGQAATFDPDHPEVWIIDPIDGTLNFVLQGNHFCTMLAYYSHGQGLYGVIFNIPRNEKLEGLKGEGLFLNGQPFENPYKDRSLDQGLMAINEKTAMANHFNVQSLIHESYGLRLYGSAGLSLSALLKGEIVLYSSPNLKIWDIAAPLILMKEAGLKASELDGQGLDLRQVDYPVLAYPKAHQQYLAHYQAHRQN